MVKASTQKESGSGPHEIYRSHFAFILEAKRSISGEPNTFIILENDVLFNSNSLFDDLFRDKKSAVTFSFVLM